MKKLRTLPSNKMNSITGKPLKFAIDTNEINEYFTSFDLDVAQNAEYQANPVEWFAKSFLNSGSRSTFRKLAGVKTETKLSDLDTGDVFKPYNCKFVPGDIDLDAITLSVCSVAIHKSFCQSEVEASFIGAELAKGSNGNITTPAFLSYIMDRLARKSDEELELITFQGNTATGEADGFLTLCDGIETILADDANVNFIKAAVGGITSLNVRAEMAKVVNKLPKRVRFRKDLRLLVSSDVMSAFLMTYAVNANEFNGVNEILYPRFGDVNLQLAEGMSDNVMIAAILGVDGDLIYLTDVDEDHKQLQIVDFSKTTLDDIIGIKANAKIGFTYTNPEQIVMYSPNVTTN